MNCEQFENVLSEYLDDTLSRPVRRHCAEHLIECPSCRGLFESVRAAVAVCRTAGLVEPQSDVSARVLQATSAGQMMSCSVFDRLILDYFDGFITASEFHIFEAHFANCARCQRLMRSIQEARELCEQAKSVEVPDGFHARIMQATSGAHRRDERRETAGALQRWASRLRAGAGMLLRPVFTPEFVTAVLLCLATVGLLLVEFSDDRSLSGVYRHARVRMAQALQGDGQAASGKRKVASDLQQVGTHLSSAIETGLGLIFKPAGSNSVPSSAPSPQQPQKRSPQESTQEAKPVDSKKAPPAAP